MTTPPSLSSNEPQRLQSLRSLSVVQTPLEERFERITRIARRVFGTQIAAISLIEAGQQWFKSIQGLDVDSTDRDVSFCGHTILGDDAFIIDDARVNPEFADNPLVTGPPHIVFYAGYPIRSADGLNIGSMCVIDTKPRAMSDEDISLLRDLAALVEGELRSASADAVQASLIEDVSAEQRRAMIDSLTRVWNRDGVFRVAGDALNSAAAGTCGAALVAIDLDFFKQINDNHGHGAGDEVLRVSVRRMIGAIRDSDAIGRLGGDEFLLVLTPCPSAEAAKTVVERVRARLCESPIRTSTVEMPVTASFGVRFVEPGCRVDLQQAIEDADDALYLSKRAGRNCIAPASVGT